MKYEADWAKGREDMLRTRNLGRTDEPDGRTDGQNDHYRAKQSSKPYFTIESIPVIEECCTSSKSSEVPFTEPTIRDAL